MSSSSSLATIFHSMALDPFSQLFMENGHVQSKWVNSIIKSADSLRAEGCPSTHDITQIGSIVVCSLSRTAFPRLPVRSLSSTTIVSAGPHVLPRLLSTEPRVGDKPMAEHRSSPALFSAAAVLGRNGLLQIRCRRFEQR